MIFARDVGGVDWRPELEAFIRNAVFVMAGEAESVLNVRVKHGVLPDGSAFIGIDDPKALAREFGTHTDAPDPWVGDVMERTGWILGGAIGDADGQHQEGGVPGGL